MLLQLSSLKCYLMRLTKKKGEFKVSSVKRKNLFLSILVVFMIGLGIWVVAAISPPPFPTLPTWKLVSPDSIGFAAAVVEKNWDRGYNSKFQFALLVRRVDEQIGVVYVTYDVYGTIDTGDTVNVLASQ